MLKRIILLALSMSLSCGLAWAQGGLSVDQTLTGASLGNGYAVNDGPLYMPTSATLQAIKLPFSSSFTAITPTFPPGTGASDSWVWGGQASTSPTTGFNMQFLGSSESFRVSFLLHPGAGGACDATAAANLCWRFLSITDSKPHHFCHVWTPTHGYFYVDGILRDETKTMGTGFTAGTSTWRFGYLFPQPTAVPGVVNALTFFDLRLYNRALTEQECGNINRLHKAGLKPNSGTLQQGLVYSLPLDNCVKVAPLVTCADASGNANNATNDKAPPVVTVLTPNTGAYSGIVSATASCVDPAGLACQAVCYMIDNSPFTSCPTTAPYTVSLDTTKMNDGVHTLTAIGFNFIGISGVSGNSKTLTTTNSVSAVSYYFCATTCNGFVPNDSNNCTTTSTPCQTIAKLQTLSLKGGDTVSFFHDQTFNTTTGFKLCGGGATINAAPACTQNYYPTTQRLTFTTFGGGSCNAVSGATTGCAIMTNSGSGAWAPFKGVNAPYVTVQNLALIGNGASITGTKGIEFDSTFPTDSSTGIIVTNDYIKDFQIEILINDPGTVPYGGLLSGYMVSDNFVTNSTHVVNGITFPVNPSSVDGIRHGPNAQGTIQGNVVEYMGGGFHNNGNGISVHNWPYAGTTPTLIQYNVVHDFGANDMSPAGGPVGIYPSSQAYTTVQFNEAYRGWPSSYPVISNMIDYDCIDLDDGAAHSLVQYNYVHDCPVQAGINLIAYGVGTYLWSYNTVRYNVIENNGCGLCMSSFAWDANSYFYNNIVVANGTPLQPLFGSCWSGPMIIAAIINNLCITDMPVAAGASIHLANILFLQLNNLNEVPLQGLLSNNAYWQIGAFQDGDWSLNKYYHGTYGTETNFPTLADVQASADYAGQEANSLFTDPKIVGPVGGGTCYTSGAPTGPQPCPSVYRLQTGSPLIGSGLDLTQAPFSLDVGNRDYYGNAIPHGTGSGFNIGVDGAAH